MPARPGSVVAGPAEPPLSAPPPPPPPGLAQPEREAPRPSSSIFEGGDQAGDESSDVVGFRGGFFLRDRRDFFRLFPLALVQADFQTTFGPGVSRVEPVAGGTDLSTKFLVRRARLGLGGELFRRWSFLVSGELGGQPLSNTTATSTTTAAQAPTSSATLADVWVNYRLCNCFNLMLGQYNAPIGIENRTPDGATPFRERNVAIRGFVIPGSKDIGLLAWGWFGDRFISYEVGVFGGDGPNRPSVDSRADFMGRVFAKPLSTVLGNELGKSAQIGVSSRVGTRHATEVAYDYPAITTGQGFPLWSGTYVDQFLRQVHVLPSSTQFLFGGELRAQAFRTSIQAEAYYVDNATREAGLTTLLANTERLGRMRGVGWYAQLSGWPLGDPWVRPEAGITAPRQLDLLKGEERPVRGLEVLGVFAGVNAKYEAASRDGTVDPGAAPPKVTVYQLGLAAQYWHTQHVRFMVEYDAYFAPGSADSAATVVPDNLTVDEAGNLGGHHLMHELGVRLALSL